MKFGACISIENIYNAKKYGFDFAELSASEIYSFSDTNWEKTKKKIISYDFPIIGFNSFCTESLPLIGKKRDFKKIQQYFDKIVKRGADLNISNIGIGAPFARILKDDDNYNLATNQMNENLEYFALTASKYSINILYEALNSSCCNFCNSTHESFETVCQLNNSNLFIVWDVYHSIIENECFDEICPYFSRIKHIHICSWSKKNFDRFYLLEKDDIYLKELFLFLKKMNYNGSISIEATDSSFNSIGKNSINLLHSNTI